jgi:hypothetical protein
MIFIGFYIDFVYQYATSIFVAVKTVFHEVENTPTTLYLILSDTVILLSYSV